MPLMSVLMGGVRTCLCPLQTMSCLVEEFCYEWHLYKVFISRIMMQNQPPAIYYVKNCNSFYVFHNKFSAMSTGDSASDLAPCLGRNFLHSSVLNGNDARVS